MNDGRHFVAPRSPTEQMLAKIWGQVLALERVGIHDNFFELGGNSLLGMRVIWQIREVFGPLLPLRMVSQLPTIEELAEHIDTSNEVNGQSAEPNLRPPVLLRQAREELIPLSFQQEYVWAFERSGSAGAVHAIQRALRLHGPVIPAVMERCFLELIDRYETLRTGFSIEKGMVAQVIKASLPFKLNLFDLSGEGDLEHNPYIRRIMREQRTAKFNLEEGPLLRACLVSRGAEHILVLTVHRIVADEKSVELMAYDLQPLYVAFAANGQTPPPYIPVQYADYAIWQRHWLHGEVLKRRVNDLNKYLYGGAQAPMDSSTDEAESVMASRVAKTAAFVLPSELSTSLLERCRIEDVTLFTLLLAAFVVFQSRWRGSSSIAVGVPITGRAHWQTLPLIGLFESKLVICANVVHKTEFGSLLRRLDTDMKKAYTLSGLPFEKLAYNPHDHSVLRPLFNSLFTWKDEPPPFPSQMAGVKWEWWTVELAETVVDIAVAVGKTSEQLIKWDITSAADVLQSRNIDSVTAELLNVLSEIGSRV